MTKFRSSSREVNFSKRKTIQLGLFEASCDTINKELIRRSDALIAKILARMVQVNTQTNKQLCSEYDAISAKALTQPAHTAQLVELKAFVDKAEKEALPKLEKSVNEARIRLEYLLENVVFTSYVRDYLSKAVCVIFSVKHWLSWCFFDLLILTSQP